MSHLLLQYSKRTIVLVLFLTGICISLSAENSGAHIHLFDLEVIQKRLEVLDSSVVKPKFTDIVAGYIRGYTVRNRPNAERILGRQVIYFPMFERLLNEHGLPNSLKYLSIVESALVPDATSRAKAVGLWQFMDDTGRYFDLEINENVDERCDPIKSTNAAIKYLDLLYNRYQSWELALAAYNGGAGRVSRAIKRGRSTNFWRIRRYLPRETRNYVPAFIAATYLMNHYEDHNLEPQYPELDLQITETIKVFDHFTFHQIAQHTDISIELVKTLNPSYLNDFIPANITGNYLTLPRRVMDKMRTFLALRRPDHNYTPWEPSPIFVYRKPRVDSRAFYQEVFYKVSEPMTIHEMARQAKCTVHQLRAWNNLKGNNLKAGQFLKLFLPKDISHFRSYLGMEIVDAFAPVPSKYLLQPFERNSILDIPHIDRRNSPESFNFLYYKVNRREKLSKIAHRIQGVSLESLMELNSFRADQVIKSGTRLRIKKL